ncbi:MAG: extracellular solute-binding protein [Myxococcaceae bacterium]|nr:extracellular solute-binding protein [Myxococcaceae bacterium]
MTSLGRLVLALLALAACSERAARSERAVVLYTVNGPELTGPVLERFRAEHPGVELQVVSVPGTGELFARVAAERGAPRADVVWGGAREAYAAHPELLAAVALPEDASTVAIDPEHRWHATDLLLQILVVNTERFEGQRPTTIAELAAPGWSGGQVVLAQPGASGTAFSVLAGLVTRHGWPLVERLVPHLWLVDDSASMFSLVREGEAAVGFMNEDLATQWAAAGVPLALIYPRDGVPYQVGCAAVIAGARHPAEGAALANFLLSAEAQAVQVREVSRRSSRRDAPPPAGVPALSDVDLIELDPALASSGKAALISTFRDTVLRGARR